MEKPEGALRRFGRALIKYREQRGFSVAELASRCGLDPAELAAIEGGQKDIHITDIFRLAAALGIRPSQLMDSL